MQGAGKNLQPHAQSAVPALRQDSNISCNHGTGELDLHRSVFVDIAIEELEGSILVSLVALVS